MNLNRRDNLMFLFGACTGNLQVFLGLIFAQRFGWVGAVAASFGLWYIGKKATNWALGVWTNERSDGQNSGEGTGSSDT